MQLQQQPRNRERILIVAQDDALRAELIETLEGAGGYRTDQARTFEEALTEILLINYDLVITEAQLPDLSGIDLLAVVNSLRPEMGVIVIDDTLSPKSALAVFRLGAADYLYKPLQMSFVLMQVERQLANVRARHSPPADTPAPDTASPRPAVPVAVRSASLLLNRQQFKRITLELSRLLSHVGADFVALVDSDKNMIGTAGEATDFALDHMSAALEVDRETGQLSPDSAESAQFQTAQITKGKTSTYVIVFGAPYVVSLVVVCPATVKAGVVWMYSKRTAAIINEMVRSANG